MLLYQVLVSTTRGKLYKSHTKTINLKHQFQRGMRNIKSLAYHILHQIFKIILIISSETMKE